MDVIGKELERIIRESVNSGKDNNGNNKETDDKEKEEGRDRRKGNTKKGTTGQRDSSEGTEGREEGTTEENKEEKSEGVSGLADLEKPEQIFLEVDKKPSKKKTTAKKGRDKVKEEIKLILVAIYSAAGTLIDECFHLTPHESELLSDAIVRYLEEHNLLETVREKSALENLIIAFASVNIPKILTYYNKTMRKKGVNKKDDKSRETQDNTGTSTDTVPGTSTDVDNVKTSLNSYYV